MWSLGVMLYELSFLKLPFEGKSKSEYKKSVLKNQIDFGAKDDDVYLKILKDLLSHNPQMRPTSDKVLETLKGCADYRYKTNEAIKINSKFYSFPYTQFNFDYVDQPDHALKIARQIREFKFMKESKRTNFER